MTTTRTEYVAVQVADGGLWHAAEWMKGDEHARTLCGRTGWIDHDAYGEPIEAVAGLYGPDSAHHQQYVECRSCLRFMAREATR